MKRFASVLLVQLLAICFAQPERPKQVHIAYGSTVETIVVTWSTMADLKGSKATVKYGIYSLEKTKRGITKKFVDGYIYTRTQFIHKVILSNLSRNAFYMYKCGSHKTGWSDLFHFRIPPPDNVWKPNIEIYGDMGFENNHALGRLIREVNSRKYDAIFHIGDIAYDMDERDGQQGDDFMNIIEPVAANIPYMTCVGNHESAQNFTNYRYRFNMPGEKDISSVAYSINMGPVHFISISTEVYFFAEEFGYIPILTQRNWLKKDLIKANLPQNRAKHPWIIVMGHRPLYCSNPEEFECNYHGSPYRSDLEKMFYTYGVDMVIGAHEHSYERLWPMYNYKVYNGTASPYIDPKAPVIFVSGSAGCREYIDDFVQPSPKWSAFRSSDYGTTNMKIYNRSHIRIEQISDTKHGTVIDRFWVVKHSHSFYPGSNMTRERLLMECNKELNYFDRYELCKITPNKLG